MDARVGVERASSASNVLIHANREVGRARERLIFAPARARDATLGAPPARETTRARDALAWRDGDAMTSNAVSYKGGLDLMAMNKRATRHKCVTAADVRRFRTRGEPILLKSGEVRAAPPRVDANATYGRPSANRRAEEIRYAEGYAPRSHTIAALIRGEFSRDWSRDASGRRGDAPKPPEPPTLRATDDDDDAKARANKAPFKMKKFRGVKSKVAAMGFF